MHIYIYVCVAACISHVWPTIRSEHFVSNRPYQSAAALPTSCLRLHHSHCKGRRLHLHWAWRCSRGNCEAFIKGRLHWHWAWRCSRRNCHVLALQRRIAWSFNLYWLLWLWSRWCWRCFSLQHCRQRWLLCWRNRRLLGCNLLLQSWLTCNWWLRLLQWLLFKRIWCWWAW